MTPGHERIRRFLNDHEPATPCLVVDTDTVAARVRELVAGFPHARLCYAVKANPEPAVLRAVLAAGGGFDVAGPAEISACLAAGAPAAALSYGNTIKKPADIAFASDRGVRDFTTDAPGDVANLAEHAPGASVSVRILVDGPASATPFGQKFGCEPDAAAALLVEADRLGLDAAGVAFHVGSQQPDPGAWEPGIAAAAKIFAACAAQGVRLRRLNIGGGFGVAYRSPVPSLAEYASAIRTAVRAHFPDEPEILLEPGRAVVAGAGLIRTEVVLVSHRFGRRWVYLDVGRYNGLAETENEAIPYRLDPLGRDGERGPVVLAGPTCDGDDVLYQRTPYELPLSLRAGDRIDILDTGAYTASYSSVAFNGIPPLRTYCLEGGRLADDT
ncbi:type III PLP-dependent enzyme [Amycolatopsis thermophila]|uniref:ornithine decarboxylase n=1 Tax=Amycolatopsis thermophila TaxID=206084 RepID=A0ABU0EXV3_9PSEU|nr:type III PLP-dependent enzyme [Amycolatopsis thermophila]MDQ0380127.1 ornithine decarboxylase [Amycolatopsis thermophila]